MNGPELFIVVPSAVGATLAAFFLLRQFKLWWRPIKLTAVVSRNYETADTEQIRAIITNISREPQLVVACNVLASYPARVALWRHLKQPFMRPKFYHTLWYGPINFDLLSERPIRLEPKEQRVLFSFMSLKYPLHRALYVTGEIKAEVRLAERRRAFRSKRTFVPKRSLHPTPKSSQ